MADNEKALTGARDETAPSPDSPISSTDSGSLVNITDPQLDMHSDETPKTEITPGHANASPTTAGISVLGPGDSERAEDPNPDDLGWSKGPKVPVPVLYEMKNEELWVLVRRFNKTIYHVKSIPPPPGKLDLNIAPTEEFFPDKLRSTIERIYVTVIIGVITGVKHIARLRTWNERNRTGGFCLAYFLAWFLNILIPFLIGTTILLIVYPPARRHLFPPAPLALHNMSTGEPQISQTGYLASADSLTGATEAYKGFAAEQEANNFVTSLTSIAVASVSGQGAPSASESVEPDSPKAQDPSREVASGEIGRALPDPISVVGGAATAQATTFGEPVEQDKTKKPMEAAVWEAAGPFMHTLNVVADMWEQFANALSPTPPFAQNTARARMAASFLPVFLLSLLVDERVLYKSVSFGVGFAVFGKPLISRVHMAPLKTWVAKHYPNWRELLDIRNTLLRGVPTNAQLTLTLLRIGEANKSPLPPPPGYQPPQKSGEDNTPVFQSDTEDSSNDSSTSSMKPTMGSKVIEFMKGAAKAAVHGAIGADYVKAMAGCEHAKLRLGVVGWTGESEIDGPTSFTARHHGKRGHVIITASATPPCISFVRHKDIPFLDTKHIFTIAVDDIAEIRKISGYGWKGKLVIGWALSTEVADGIEITDKSGVIKRLTAMPRRDEVFNRVIAVSPKQHWESC